MNIDNHEAFFDCVQLNSIRALKFFTDEKGNLCMGPDFEKLKELEESKTLTAYEKLRHSPDMDSPKNPDPSATIIKEKRRYLLKLNKPHFIPGCWYGYYKGTVYGCDVRCIEVCELGPFRTEITCKGPKTYYSELDASEVRKILNK